MMQKKIIYLLIIITAVLVTGCGFKNINQNIQKTLHIEKINTSGNKRINYVLKNEIMVYSNASSTNKIIIDLNTKKNKSEKIKDISGKITRFNVQIETQMTIKKNNNIVVKKVFNDAGDYDVGTSHSDTISAEKKLNKSIAEKISEDIIFFLNLYYKN